jgi:FAD binding domain-containing protein
MTELSRILPPGVSREQLGEAITRFREVVGDKYVLTEDGDLARFRDPYPVGADLPAGASAVVSPETAEQVQEIVRIANEFGVPLSPVSTGKNNGYGGAQPRLFGAVVVNTGDRMNRIIEVNERFGYALLEPGVTYFDLYEYLKENAPSLMVDCPDLGWGSVVGNTLDRGVGYTPYGDHFMWQTGLEVVLPTGGIMRTGMGAVPGSNAWQLFPYGFGPYPDGMPSSLAGRGPRTAGTCASLRSPRPTAGTPFGRPRWCGSAPTSTSRTTPRNSLSDCGRCTTSPCSCMTPMTRGRVRSCPGARSGTKTKSIIISLA